MPEQVCAYLLCALHLYTLDPEAGIAAMNQLRGPRPMTPYDGQFLRDRLRGKAYLPQSYFHGASPTNNYTPAQPYVLEVLPDPRPQDVEAGYLRFYLKSGGATLNPDNNPEYRSCKQLGEEICAALTQVRKAVRENIEAANAPKQAVTCPFCGATTTPDASGCCEFCGGAVKG